MTAFFRKLRWLTERRHKEAELREELQFHLDEEAEERQGEGVTEEEARWAARRALGNLTLIQEDTRATWGWTILEQLGQDLRYACRTIDRTINQEITFARLCTGFAILALVIACVGLYGTVSQTVAQRTGEIGIRMALGAPRRRIVWMVLREVLVLAAVGLPVGLGAALGTSGLVASFLYEVKPNDPVALTLPVMIFLSAALLAGYVPARKASRIDPLTAIRQD